MIEGAVLFWGIEFGLSLGCDSLLRTGVKYMGTSLR